MTREQLGEAIYNALYAHQGGLWRCVETRDVWYDAADRLIPTFSTALAAETERCARVAHQHGGASVIADAIRASAPSPAQPHFLDLAGKFPDLAPPVDFGEQLAQPDAAKVERVARAIAAKVSQKPWQCECTEQRGDDCNCGDAMTDEPCDRYDDEWTRNACRDVAVAAIAAGEGK